MSQNAEKQSIGLSNMYLITNVHICCTITVSKWVAILWKIFISSAVWIKLFRCWEWVDQCCHQPMYSMSVNHPNVCWYIDLIREAIDVINTSPVITYGYVCSKACKNSQHPNFYLINKVGWKRNLYFFTRSHLRILTIKWTGITQRITSKLRSNDMSKSTWLPYWHKWKMHWNGITCCVTCHSLDTSERVSGMWNHC